VNLNGVYIKMLAELERELDEIDYLLTREDKRRLALEYRRAEVVEGINGIKERITW
jgi:hypothetical protein